MTFRLHYHLPALLAAVILLPAATSCKNEDGPSDKEEDKTAVLLYAIASNNLSIKSDKREILEAASNMNLSGKRMFVYEVTNTTDTSTNTENLPTGVARLLELTEVPGRGYLFHPVKQYDRSRYSTDPLRIAEVISDFRTLTDADVNGLILWSHGTGWIPSFSTHPTGSTRSVPQRSFGSDRNPQLNSRYYDETDIDELADAIPDGFFNFIWFDACFMSGIETIYQLRNKCDNFVGYPTEVYTPGMPYDLTIPYILRDKPDLVGGAEAFFNYYAKSSNMNAATVAVLDMSKLEAVADFCKESYEKMNLPEAKVLQRYHTGSHGPFYDFGQYTRLMAEGEDSDVAEFRRRMDELVVYKAATPRSFGSYQIEPENYSGISCHLYDPAATTDREEYYRTLDWFQRVYPGE